MSHRPTARTNVDALAARHLRRFAVAIALGCVAYACTEFGLEIVGPISPASVEMSFSLNGRPLRKTAVEIYLGPPSPTNDLPYLATMTDANGSVIVRDLTMATYFVRVSSAGKQALSVDVPLEKERSTVEGGIRMSVRPLEVEMRTVNASGSSATPDVPTLKAELKRFSGQVEDPSGAVIPDSAINIKTQGKTSQTIVADIRTDSRGSFFADLPSGAYRATFTVPGFIAQTLDFSIATDGWRGLELVMPLGTGCGLNTALGKIQELD